MRQPRPLTLWSPVLFTRSGLPGGCPTAGRRNDQGDHMATAILNDEGYRAMFENAGVGITRVDLEGALADVNQKFCEMVGYTRDELMHRPVKHLTHPDDYGQGAAFRDQLTSGTKSSATGEKRFLRKDGSIIWARRTMS